MQDIIVKTKQFNHLLNAMTTSFLSEKDMLWNSLSISLTVRAYKSQQSNYWYSFLKMYQ